MTGIAQPVKRGGGCYMMANIPDAGRAGGYFAYDAAAVPFSSVANDLL
jgi:hypothetical protein